MTTLQRMFRRYWVQTGRMFKPTRRRVADALRQGWYVVIDDEQTYAEGHVMMLPAYLSTNLVWVADPMIGLLTTSTYRRVVKAATEAFTLAALVDQGKRGRSSASLFFLAINGELA